MNVANKVVESQRKIINALAEVESSIGLLYEKYAVCFPAMKAQWLALAKAERMHSDLLKTMHRILDKGSIFYNLGKFNEQALQPMVLLIADALKKADDAGLTAGDAVATALKIESSLMDSHFYDVVASDASEFKIIAERLSSETRKHVDAIRGYAHK